MADPCFHSVECHNIGNGSFECESCPEGFEGDGQTCTDVNEVITTDNYECEYNRSRRMVNWLLGVYRFIQSTSRKFRFRN